METPLSGSHLGPHTRPMCPCNKAVGREAVCSFVTPLHRRLLIHQLPSTGGHRRRKPIQLDKAESPCKGLGVAARRVYLFTSMGMLEFGTDDKALHPVQEFACHQYIAESSVSRLSFIWDLKQAQSIV